jgi:hypothetical protein
MARDGINRQAIAKMMRDIQREFDKHPIRVPVETDGPALPPDRRRVRSHGLQRPGLPRRRQRGAAGVGQPDGGINPKPDSADRPRVRGHRHRSGAHAGAAARCRTRSAGPAGRRGRRPGDTHRGYSVRTGSREDQTRLDRLEGVPRSCGDRTGRWCWGRCPGMG